ncbi:Uncharacterised protein [Enterobacter hormaechei]|uniref:hypothetical protein n=1 Tax=Enterobacter hormaechei TaxID=158836 RepID=UPI00079A4807|nr:hypothetical protein [Enterobacter hormaechei]SAG83741.1 Uncharacterised protein [Enterobacter hormaechei]
MTKLKSKYSHNVIILITIAIFFFFLPAIGAVIGSLGDIYVRGLYELLSFGVKAIIVSLWMLAVGYLLCHLMKADKSFLRTPAIMTLIGAVLLPLVRSFQIVMTSSHQDENYQTELVTKSINGMIDKSIEGMETIVKGIMFIAPATLCITAVIFLAVGLTNLFLKRNRKSA